MAPNILEFFLFNVVCVGILFSISSLKTVAILNSK